MKFLALPEFSHTSLTLLILAPSVICIWKSSWNSNAWDTIKQFNRSNYLGWRIFITCISYLSNYTETTQICPLGCPSLIYGIRAVHDVVKMEDLFLIHLLGFNYRMSEVNKLSINTEFKSQHIDRDPDYEGASISRVLQHTTKSLWNF